MTCQLPTPETLMMDTWLLEYNKDAAASARLPLWHVWMPWPDPHWKALSGEQLFDQLSRLRLPV